MITNQLNLSMSNPKIVQAFAKQGDKGRIYKINLDDATEENGTMRIKRVDGEEYTSPALSTVSPTITDGMATFDSLEEAEVTELKIALSPKQDLHGYANPWPSGGGKNKFDIDSATMYTRYFSSTNLWQRAGDSASFAFYCQQNTQYTISCSNSSLSIFRAGCINVDPSTLADSNSPQIYEVTRKSTDGSITLTTTNDAVAIVVQLTQAYAYDSYLQIELGATATSYAPYSNICPIYPSNGKNLWRLDNAYSADASGSFIPVDASRQFPLAKGTYTWSFDALSTIHAIQLNFRTAGDVSKQITFYPSAGTGKKSYTFTLDEDVTVLRNGYCDGAFSLKNMQIELGSFATPYVPYQGINLYQVGKNLLKNNLASGTARGITYTVNSDGTIDVSGTLTGSGAAYLTLQGGFLSAKAELPDWLRKGESYIISDGVDETDYRVTITLYKENGTSVTFQDQEFTVPDDALYYGVFLLFYPSAVGQTINKTFYPMIRKEGSATYEPYNGTTYPLSLGQSVYGGTLDVVSGKLTIDRALVTLDGTQTLTQNGTMAYGGINVKFVPNPTKKNGATLNEGLMSDTFNAISANYTKPYYFEGRTTNGNLFFNMPADVTTKALADAWFSNNPTQVSYLLAEPIEVDLTPTQISTLLGENNVWSDGEITELTFEYDGLLSLLTADQTAVVGRCIGDVLFTNVSTMPFTLNVIPNNQEETP